MDYSNPTTIRVNSNVKGIGTRDARGYARRDYFPLSRGLGVSE